MDLSQVGKQFLAEVLANVEEADRAAVEAAFGKAPKAVEALGAGAKRQSEFSRAMDELRANDAKLKQEAEALAATKATVQETYEKQTAWWEANKARLAAVSTSTDDDPLKQAKPADIPADVVRRADLDEAGRGVVAFNAYTIKLALRHAREFPGEDLDIQDLANKAAASKGQKTIEDVYQDTFGAKLKEKADAARAAEIQRQVDAKVQEVLKTHRSSAPYPLASMAGSPLDVLKTDKPDPSQFTVDAAADEYARLVALKAGASV